jgi:hypothetical protein
MPRLGSRSEVKGRKLMFEVALFFAPTGLLIPARDDVPDSGDQGQGALKGRFMRGGLVPRGLLIEFDPVPSQALANTRGRIASIR